MGDTMGLSEGWKRTVGDGTTNKAWDEYDSVIQTEVTRLQSQAGCHAWLRECRVDPAQSRAVGRKRGAPEPQLGRPVRSKSETRAILPWESFRRRPRGRTDHSTHLKADVKSRLNEPKINVQAVTPTCSRA